MNRLVSLLPLDVLPNPTPQAPPGNIASLVSSLLNWLTWGGLTLAIGGLIILGAMLAVKNRRGEGADTLGGIGFLLLGIVIIGSASAIVGFFM